MAILATVAVLFAICLAITLYFLLFRRDIRESSCISSRLDDLARSNLVEPVSQSDGRRHLGAMERIFKGKLPFSKFIYDIEQANIPLSPPGLIAIVCSASLLFFLLGAVLFNILCGLALAVIPFAGARTVVSIMRRRRLEAMNEQFPDALDLMTRGLRAGHALSSVLEMVSIEMSDPIKTEFNRIFLEFTHGKSLIDAIEEFSARVELEDVKFFEMAIKVHMESGGNLAEILDNLAELVRDRYTVKREVLALTSESRSSAKFLTVLPIGLFAILALKSPSYIDRFTSNDDGQTLLGAAGILLVAGALVLKKMVTFREG